MSDESEVTVDPVTAAREAALKAFDEVSASEPAAATEPAVAAVAAQPEPAAAPVPNPSEVAIAERLAEIVRAESALVAKQQAMKAEADAARAEAKRAAEQLAEYERQLAENPLELLRAKKWELEDIVKVAATKQTPEAVRIAKLEAEMARRDKLEAERQESAKAATAAQEAEAARKTLVQEYIPKQLAVAKDELKLCNLWFTPEELALEVYNVMGREFNRTKNDPKGPTALEPAEAARKVEEALRKRVEKVNPSASVTPETKQAPKPKPTVKPSTTVTNQHTQHRTTEEEQIAPGDVAAYRRRALAVAAEFFDR